jgi:hypothetical protein
VNSTTFAIEFGNAGLAPGETVFFAIEGYQLNRKGGTGRRWGNGRKEAG